MLNTEARRWTSSANVHWVTERVGRGQGCRDEGWESHWYLGHDVAMSSWTPSASLGLGFLSRRRKWQPTPVLLPGKSQGWRILAGYSPWVCKESDATLWLNNNNIFVILHIDRLQSHRTSFTPYYSIYELFGPWFPHQSSLRLVVGWEKFAEWWAHSQIQSAH